MDLDVIPNIAEGRSLPTQCAYSANVVTLGHNFFWTPQSALFFLKCIIMVVERGAHFLDALASLELVLSFTPSVRFFGNEIS